MKKIDFNTSSGEMSLVMPDIKNHPTYLSSDYMRLICQPIIEYFNAVTVCYSLEFTNQKRIIITTSPECILHEYSEGVFFRM